MSTENPWRRKPSLTRLSWVSEPNLKRTLCYSPKRPRVITKISVVLGLADTRGNDQGTVYGEFKENLERNRAGCYKTKLPWKDNHPTLPTNEMGSRRRVEQLIKWLRRNESYKNYNNIIQDQLQQGVIKMAHKESSGEERSQSHTKEWVSKQVAETTKLHLQFTMLLQGRAPSHHWTTASTQVFHCRP